MVSEKKNSSKFNEFFDSKRNPFLKFSIVELVFLKWLFFFNTSNHLFMFFNLCDVIFSTCLHRPPEAKISLQIQFAPFISFHRKRERHQGATLIHF